MQYNTFRGAVENIDWKLLQQQKKTLENLLISLPSCEKISNATDKKINTLWGLIEFIENLQDVHETEPN
jgi:hypothetical protein